MTNAHERKKQPELVRQKLLDCAAEIAVNHGLRDVTIQAVADAAGVTKGGLLHHYPSRQHLEQALFDELLDRLDRDIDGFMAGDTSSRGCFTRAYVRAVTDMDWSEKHSPWAALSILTISDAASRQRWNVWLHGRLKCHEKTDSGSDLQIVRCAADGVWLAALSESIRPQERPDICAELIKLADKVSQS
jgi:Transcriptional regulator